MSSGVDTPRRGGSEASIAGDTTTPGTAVGTLTAGAAGINGAGIGVGARLDTARGACGTGRPSNGVAGAFASSAC